MWCNIVLRCANGRDFAAERHGVATTLDASARALVAITRAEYPLAARFRHVSIPPRDCGYLFEDVIARETALFLTPRSRHSTHAVALEDAIFMENFNYTRNAIYMREIKLYEILIITS